MRIFISCSRRDQSWGESLAARLRQAGLEVWLDRDLVGSQAWWDTVLAQLRSCSAVVAGVSKAYLNSPACRSERAYAVDLGKPVLPVIIESINAAMLPSDLARLQIIDFSRPDEAAAFRLIGAIFALPPSVSLPDPLPGPPSIPTSYLSAVAAQLASTSLSLDDQLAIIGRLEYAVGPTAAPDEIQAATEMLRELAGRPDLFASAARRIESLLAQADATDQSRGSYLAAGADRSAMPPDSDTLRDTAGAQHLVPDPFPPPPGQSQESKAGEAKVFISYAHRDARYRQQLETHLSALRRQGAIAEWHDQKIMPGAQWRDAIDQNLDSADCVLLLVTPDFIASDYCYSIEMQRALEKHREGRALVIPVIVRPADWQHTPLRDLEALPEGAKPVIEWARRDRAWLSVAEGVRLALVSSSQAKPEQKARGGDTHKLRDGADLATLEQQARSSGQAGNAASARDQYAALLPAYERILGPEHPETLNTRNSLAWFTGHAGDPTSARDQLAALLPADERALGAEHPYTLATRNYLAHFTGAAGDPASARDQYAALLPVMERILGPSHPDTLAARGSLANWSAQTHSDHDDTADAWEGAAANSKLQREIAAMKEFDVPADKGLTRVQASEALKRHGINPKAFGPWVRHGWVIRNGDRRYLSPKGRQWLTDHQTSL